jgi:hypothetical protein
VSDARKIQNVVGSKQVCLRDQVRNLIAKLTSEYIPPYAEWLPERLKKLKTGTTDRDGPARVLSARRSLTSSEVSTGKEQLLFIGSEPLPPVCVRKPRCSSRFRARRITAIPVLSQSSFSFGEFRNAVHVRVHIATK